tara:strand:- start:800 stop:1021 length:222 start_codon:yes stop_codon:yes gene_type:complete
MENQEQQNRYLIELVNEVTSQSAVFSTESNSFPEAMADAYVQRHNLSQTTAEDWKIVSVLDKTYFAENNRRLP